MFKGIPTIAQTIEHVLSMKNDGIVTKDAIFLVAKNICKNIQEEGGKGDSSNIAKKIKRELEDYEKNVTKTLGGRRSKKIVWMSLKSNPIFIPKPTHNPTYVTSTPSQDLEEVEEDDEKMDFSQSSVNSMTSNNFYSITRSGLIRPTFQKTDNASQTIPTEFPEMKTKTGTGHGSRYNDNIKTTICNISCKCGITLKEAKTAFLVTSNMFFDQHFEMEDLPSLKTLQSWKFLMALQQEQNTAFAIIQKQSDDAICAHLDFTKRQKIKGEWPSLLININNETEEHLRPLILCTENRQEISNMLVETFKRLAFLSDKTPVEIYQGIDALMTDSVSKNQHVAKIVAASLGTSHIPVQLLCNAHPVEAFERAIIEVITQLENSVQLRERLIKRFPFLTSFLNAKCVTLAAMEAITAYITNTGKTSSGYEEFEEILSRKHKSTRITKINHKRFGHNGMTASSILENIEEIKELCSSQLKRSNRLSMAVDLYINCDFIATMFKAFEFFTSRVTIPYLNFVSSSNQLTFSEKASQIYNGLKSFNTEFLEDYYVPLSSKTKPTLETATDTNIQRLFFEKAAEVFLRQKGNEYGLVLDGGQRAADVTQMEKSFLEKLPADNLACERDFSHFDRLARRAALCANRKYTGEGIKNDMVLYKSNITVVTDDVKKKAVQMKKMEKTWDDRQKKMMKEKLMLKETGAAKIVETGNLLLLKTKTWGGPITNGDELNNLYFQTDMLSTQKIIESLSSLTKQIHQTNEKDLKGRLRTEIQLKKNLSPRDSVLRPNLYKVNKMTVEELTTNLKCIIHCDDIDIETMELPSNDDLDKALNDINPDSIKIPKTKLIAFKGENSLCLGICTKQKGDICSVEPLTPITDKHPNIWGFAYPTTIIPVQQNDVLDCNVLGEWNMGFFLFVNQAVAEEMFQMLN